MQMKKSHKTDRLKNQQLINFCSFKIVFIAPSYYVLLNMFEVTRQSPSVHVTLSFRKQTFHDVFPAGNGIKFCS
jgi:hypothetical protein